MVQELCPVCKKSQLIEYKAKKCNKHRTSDDIIDAIARTTIEREAFNSQRQKQSVAYCEQLKQSLKALDAMVNTLTVANTPEGEGMTRRQKTMQLR